MEKKENGRQRIIFDGTAFYEIDLECVEQKRKDQEEREEDIRKEVEKGDTLAMILSALIVILPVAVVVLLLLALFGALPLFLD